MCRVFTLVDSPHNFISTVAKISSTLPICGKGRVALTTTGNTKLEHL